MIGQDPSQLIGQDPRQLIAQVPQDLELLQPGQGEDVILFEICPECQQIAIYDQ